MAESIFQDIQSRAFRAGVTPRTQESREWFRKQLANMRSINRQRLLKDKLVTKTNRPRIGDMYMFYYDAKHKDTLPYWDQFPLVILTDKAPNGFYGLNLHYLPLNLRARLFDSLLETATNRAYNDTTRMRARYDLLKGVGKMKYYKPCFHRYLTSHVDSGIVKVEPAEWEIALFMPIQKFKGATASQVWKDSKDKF